MNRVNIRESGTMSDDQGSFKNVNPAILNNINNIEAYGRDSIDMRESMRNSAFVNNEAIDNEDYGDEDLIDRNSKAKLNNRKDSKDSDEY